MSEPSSGRSPRRTIACILISCTAAVALSSCNGSSAAPISAKTLFGATSIYDQLRTRTGDLLAAGWVCPGKGCRSSDDLVLGGAIRVGGAWRVRLLERFGMGPSDACSWRSTFRLVPNEPVIIVGCLYGGSDDEGFVVVLGIDSSTGLPEVLFSADCGITQWVLDGATLVIHSSGLKEGNQPDRANPTFALRWSGAVLYESPDDLGTGIDDSTYPTFCEELVPA